MAFNYNAINGYQPGGQIYNPNFGTGGPTWSVTPQVQPTPQNPSSSFVWVQGEAAAKSYPVAPGNKIALFDSDDPVVYIKSVDQTGKPLEFEVYDLVKREAEQPIEQQKQDLSEFIKRDEIEALIAAATKDEVERAISEISLKPTSKKKKGDDE